MAIIANWKMWSDGTDSVWGYNGTSTITYWVGWPTNTYGIFPWSNTNYISVPDNDAFSSANQVFSLSLWLYSWNQARAAFLFAKWTSSGNYEWWMSVQAQKTNALKYTLPWASWYSSLWTPLVYSTNKWVHIIDSWNNNYPIIYVNWVEIPTKIFNTATPVAQNGTSPVTIWRRGDGYPLLWRLADVKYRNNFVTAWMAKSEYIFFKWFY